ncbi:MAG: endoglucanase [Betaproteobacteria bacterium]|nr:endoglucanase [Betaproteobacteria bacterium]
MRLTRTLPVISLLCLLWAGPAVAAQDGGNRHWQRYLEAFVTRDGRVIDHRQNQISHSEGQAYGMLLALAFNDRALFDRIHAWAGNNLRVRGDKLHAWKWGKRDDGSWGLLDGNNATDGDLLIAWALHRAAGKWTAPTYDSAARELAAEIRTRLAREWRGHLVLLPGMTGFEEKEALALNPSYIVPAAYRALADIDDRAFWERAANDGEKLLYGARFGLWGLPPDWLALSDRPAPHPGKGAYFGHDALRIFLYTAEAGSSPERLGLSNLLAFSARTGYLPQRVNLFNDEVSIQEAPAGHYAVLARAARLAGDAGNARRLMAEADKRISEEQDNYYSATLYLLAVSGALD